MDTAASGGKWLSTDAKRRAAGYRKSKPACYSSSSAGLKQAKLTSFFCKEQRRRATNKMQEQGHLAKDQNLAKEFREPWPILPSIISNKEKATGETSLNSGSSNKLQPTAIERTESLSLEDVTAQSCSSVGCLSPTNSSIDRPSSSPVKNSRSWYYSPRLYADCSEHDSMGETLPPVTDSLIREALSSPTSHESE